MSTHPDFYWTAGDDWQISATLLDNTGLPFDLSGTPDIRWALVSEKTGETVLTEADVNVVVVGEPAEGTVRYSSAARGHRFACCGLLPRCASDFLYRHPFGAGVWRELG